MFLVRLFVPLPSEKILDTALSTAYCPSKSIVTHLWESYNLWRKRKQRTNSTNYFLTIFLAIFIIILNKTQNY